MELPGLGNICAEKSCKQLDFLPMKCDACQNIFCKDHIMYDGHSCPESYRKDNQVPICPLCNKLIPVKPGSTPDLEVGRHIDTDCQSDPAKERRGKVFTNKCNLKGCKAKELVPMVCERCQKNFCVRHRHELDHNCKGFEGSGKPGSSAGAAAAARAVTNGVTNKSNKTPQQTTLSGFGRDLDRSRQQRQQQQQQRVASGAIQHLQGTLSEDEAMAQALAMSMADSKPTDLSNLSPDEVLLRQQQEEADFALAQALAQSEQNAPQPTQRQTSSESKDRCTVS